MIYLFLTKYSEDALCLFPFTSCLTCMIERGCLARLYDHYRERMPSKGHLSLIGPEGNIEKMSWVTLNHIHEEHTVPR